EAQLGKRLEVEAVSVADVERAPAVLPPVLLVRPRAAADQGPSLELPQRGAPEVDPAVAGQAEDAAAQLRAAHRLGFERVDGFARERPRAAVDRDDTEPGGEHGRDNRGGGDSLYLPAEMDAPLQDGDARDDRGA